MFRIVFSHMYTRIPSSPPPPRHVSERDQGLPLSRSKNFDREPHEADYFRTILNLMANLSTIVGWQDSHETRQAIFDHVLSRLVSCDYRCLRELLSELLLHYRIIIGPLSVDDQEKWPVSDSLSARIECCYTIKFLPG